jgi:hypothetical protein
MTTGSTGPEYIPSKEGRRRNREKARPEGTTQPSPVAGEEANREKALDEVKLESSPVVGQETADKASSGTEATPTEARGRNGVVSFDGHFVTINRKGFLARATVGKGEKRIPLASISGVQFKPAGAMVNGFIQFTVPGGNERRSRFGHQSWDATKDENAVLFTKAQMPQFLALRGNIEQAIAARFAPQATTPVAPNPVEQIQQLAALRDQGILTQEEFEAKKSELLSRV